MRSADRDMLVVLLLDHRLRQLMRIHRGTNQIHGVS